MKPDNADERPAGSDVAVGAPGASARRRSWRRPWRRLWRRPWRRLWRRLRTDGCETLLRGASSPAGRRGRRAFVFLLLALVPALEAQDRPWSGIRTWAYVLQDPDPRALARHPADLFVIDYSRDGSYDRRFTAREVALIREGCGGGRRVLAYLSIGEAEDYRYYWRREWRRRPPPWLAEENPDFGGNFKVRYWDPAWQEIILGTPGGYLDQILEAGFDGVYLDLIDAFEYFEDRGVEDARDRMKAFVARIAVRARKVTGRPGFGVFPQNGEVLVQDPAYLSLITGIGREDTYFGYEADDAATPPRATREIENHLDRVIGTGKLVLNIDYATTPAHILEAHRRARRKGYVEYVTVRELDRLVPQPEVPGPE